MTKRKIKKSARKIIRKTNKKKRILKKDAMNIFYELLKKVRDKKLIKIK